MSTNSVKYGTLTRAEFDLSGGWEGGYKYIRAAVIDKDGKYAWTNPIFLKKVFNSFAIIQM